MKKVYNIEEERTVMIKVHILKIKKKYRIVTDTMVGNNSNFKRSDSVGKIIQTIDVPQYLYSRFNASKLHWDDYSSIKEIKNYLIDCQLHSENRAMSLVRNNLAMENAINMIKEKDVKNVKGDVA